MDTYIIVSAPSGCGLREAISKLSAVIEDIEVQDVEDELCKNQHVRDAINAAGYNRPSRPSMYDITWYLSRSQVCKLWEESVPQLITNLSDSKKKVKVLSCHLIYYSGRRAEFYSPINLNLLHNNHIKPSHVILLIDDVYDMYNRLTAENALFNPKSDLQGWMARIREEENVDIVNLPPEELSSLFIEWQNGVLNHLLGWRHSEIVIAENTARQSKSNFLVWSTKQLTRAVAHAIQEDKPFIVYLSHPISRPRQQFIQSGPPQQWPDVVGEFNRLQNEFLKQDIVAVMPTGIDELRIKKVRTQQKFLARRPLLETRWPLPADVKFDLYTASTTNGDINHERIMWFKTWDFPNRAAIDLPDPPSERLLERADSLVRSLEKQIELQISTRDHLFVSWTDALLVYRPFYAKGAWSGGVRAEIDHWKMLAKAEVSRRAVFIHFEEDVKNLLQYLSSDERKPQMLQEIRQEVIKIYMRQFGLNERLANDVLDHIKAGAPRDRLDAGPAPGKDIQLMADSASEIQKIAEAHWLKMRLTAYEIGAEVSEGQVALCLVLNSDHLKREFPNLCNFIKNGKAIKEVNLDDFLGFS